MSAPAPPLTYLQAASAGIRRQTSVAGTHDGPASRSEIDALHAHMTAVHQLADQLAERTREAATRAVTSHLTAARTRIWQATAHLHDAFHHTPHPEAGPLTATQECRPEQDLPPRLPLLTTCQRHLATAAVVRRQTTPADLHDPLHGHTHHPASGQGQP